MNCPPLTPGTVCFLHTGKADRTAMALSAFYAVFMLYAAKQGLGETRQNRTALSGLTQNMERIV